MEMMGMITWKKTEQSGEDENERKKPMCYFSACGVKIWDPTRWRISQKKNGMSWLSGKKQAGNCEHDEAKRNLQIDNVPGGDNILLRGARENERLNDRLWTRAFLNDPRGEKKGREEERAADTGIGGKYEKKYDN